MIWNLRSNPLIVAKATWQGDIKRHPLHTLRCSQVIKANAAFMKTAEAAGELSNECGVLVKNKKE